MVGTLLGVGRRGDSATILNMTIRENSLSIDWEEVKECGHLGQE